MKDAQKPDHVSLNTIIGRLREGRLVIPDFQREFEWEPWDIRELMRSIFLGYYTIRHSAAFMIGGQSWHRLHDTPDAPITVVRTKCLESGTMDSEMSLWPLSPRRRRVLKPPLTP